RIAREPKRDDRDLLRVQLYQAQGQLPSGRWIGCLVELPKEILIGRMQPGAVIVPRPSILRRRDLSLRHAVQRQVPENPVAEHHGGECRGLLGQLESPACGERLWLGRNASARPHVRDGRLPPHVVRSLIARDVELGELLARAVTKCTAGGTGPARLRQQTLPSGGVNGISRQSAS